MNKKIGLIFVVSALFLAMIASAASTEKYEGNGEDDSTYQIPTSKETPTIYLFDSDESDEGEFGNKGRRTMIDTFSEPGLKGWEIINGEWSIENGELRTMEGYGHQYAFNKRARFGELTAQVNVKVNSSYNHPAITFRAKNANNHYICRVNQWSSRPWDGLQLYKKFNPDLGETPIDTGWTMLDSLPWKDVENGKLEMDWDEWYTMKVEAEGPTIKCKMWKTGTEEPDWQLEAVDNTFSEGLIGLEFYTGSHSFDDFKVSGTSTWEEDDDDEENGEGCVCPECPGCSCPECPPCDVNGTECPPCQCEECPTTTCPRCPTCPAFKNECPIIKDHTIHAKTGQKHVIPGTKIELLIEYADDGSVIIQVHDKRLGELNPEKPKEPKVIPIEVKNYKNIVRPIEITETDGETAITEGKTEARVVGQQIRITQEEIEISTPQGQTKKVKVLPETVMERAGKAMSETWELTLEVKEEKPVYTVSGVKTKKIFGILPVNKAVTMEINAETGETNKTQEEAKWWDIIATD